MSKGLQRGLAAVVLAPLLYALLGFFLLPWAGLKIVNQKLAEYATLPARLERIEFNPFSLELTLHQLRIGAPGTEELAFARLYANLQVDSLWQGALHLRELQLERPHVELLFAADRPFNLLRLFQLPAADGTPEPPADEPFPLYVDRLLLSGGSLHLLDERPQPPVELRYDALDLELQRFGTRAEDNGEFSLTASGSSGANLALQGQLALQPLHVEGRLDVTDIGLPTWWPYVRRLVALELAEGMADVASEFRLDLKDGLHLQLANGQVQLSTLRLRQADGQPLLDLDRLEMAAERLELAPGQLGLGNGRFALAALRLHRPSTQPLLTLASLEASDISADLATRQAVIGQLRSQGLEAWGAREADGRLDWQVLLEQQLAQLRPAATDSAPQPLAAATPPDANASEAPGAAPTGPWQVLLKDTQLRDWRAHLEDRAVSPAVPLQVGPLDLDLQDVTSSGEQPWRLRLAGGIGAGGRLQAAGTLRLQPLSGQLQVQARALDLRLAQSYLSPFVRLELRSGELDADLAVDLQGVTPLALHASGTAAVNRLHTLDTIKERDFVRWQTLDLDGLDYRHGEQLRIDRVRLQQPYARFIINEDLSTNVKELLIPQPPAPAAAQPGKPLHLLIGGIEIRDGSANFADFSLTPDFATAIQQLNGSIGTLDNQSNKPASVDIRGKVDRYAPVSIKGRLTPFSPLEQMDIATRFQRVELTTLTPYAGKFAGYKIRKGRLNLDLHYRISKGQLDAENRVLLEDLQLGERVDSPSATDLPVRLAVALLRDTEGNIDIALPVQGDLNDPQFSVVPIVWQTLRNLVLRAVQAPFKLIAGLANGSEAELDKVPFAAGSSALSEAARDNLAKLGQALQQKPELRLEVEGMSVAAVDGAPLAERRLAREYQDTWYRMLQRRGDKVPAEASQIEVPEDMKAVLLEGIYRARLKQQPPAEWRELKKPERAARLQQAVLASWAQSPLLQRQLAQDRARAIKAWLVEQGGLADERIYLLEVGSSEATAADGLVNVPLHLDSE